MRRWIGSVALGSVAVFGLCAAVDVATEPRVIVVDIQPDGTTEAHEWVWRMCPCGCGKGSWVRDP